MPAEVEFEQQLVPSRTRLDRTSHPTTQLLEAWWQPCMDRDFRLLSLAGVFEDLEDLLDEGLALVGWEVSGVDGLFI